MKYLTLFVLQLTDWVLTKLGLFIGAEELNPVVSWTGGIDNALVLKIVCWAAAVTLVPVVEIYYPKLGHRIFNGGVLFYAAVCLWNAYQIARPIL